MSCCDEDREDEQGIDEEGAKQFHCQGYDKCYDDDHGGMMCLYVHAQGVSDLLVEEDGAYALEVHHHIEGEPYCDGEQAQHIGQLQGERTSPQQLEGVLCRDIEEMHDDGSECHGKDHRRGTADSKACRRVLGQLEHSKDQQEVQGDADRQQGQGEGEGYGSSKDYPMHEHIPHWYQIEA